MAVYEPKREDQVFANVVAHNRGPLSSEAVRRVFERIIDEMRTVQKLKILQKDSWRHACRYAGRCVRGSNGGRH
jgi:chorismate mutase